MTGLSIVGTVAAYFHLRQANAELEALTEKRDGILAAVRTYNRELHDYKNEKELSQIRVDAVDFPDGVMVSTMLRVGNLVGQFMRAQASVILTNTSDQDYKLYKVAADCKIWNYAVGITRTSGLNAERVKQETSANIILHAGETVEVTLPGGISGIYNEKGENELGKLRDVICKACGKRLITSCGKMNIDNIETADILFTWSKVGDDKIYTCKASNRPGVLRYCMEAFYPN